MISSHRSGQNDATVCPATLAASCVADITGDLDVDVEDLLVVLAFFGDVLPRADFDLSGSVDVADVLFVLGVYGTQGC